MSTTQIHRIFIDAPPEKVWEAITTPEFSRLYGYTGEVLECDRPRRLVQTWAPVWIQDEEPGTVTWDIEATADGATRLTLTHEGLGAETARQVAGNPDPMGQGGGGWPWVLSGLKTVLETGRAMERQVWERQASAT